MTSFLFFCRWRVDWGLQKWLSGLVLDPFSSQPSPQHSFFFLTSKWFLLLLHKTNRAEQRQLGCPSLGHCGQDLKGPWPKGTIMSTTFPLCFYVNGPRAKWKGEMKPACHEAPGQENLKCSWYSYCLFLPEPGADDGSQLMGWGEKKDGRHHRRKALPGSSINGFLALLAHVTHWQLTTGGGYLGKTKSLAALWSNTSARSCISFKVTFGVTELSHLFV